MHFACGGGGTGRRTSLRGWRGQLRDGSIPFHRTIFESGTVRIRVKALRNQGFFFLYLSNKNHLAILKSKLVVGALNGVLLKHHQTA
jgi:hypothetical protein